MNYNSLLDYLEVLYLNRTLFINLVGDIELLASYGWQYCNIPGVSDHEYRTESTQFIMDFASLTSNNSTYSVELGILFYHIDTTAIYVTPCFTLTGNMTK
jgi:hypothetical protein